jgi:hypothetical protein
MLTITQSVDVYGGFLESLPAKDLRQRAQAAFDTGRKNLYRFIIAILKAKENAKTGNQGRRS